MSYVESAECDECGGKVPPWGCCVISRARVNEINWLRDRELKWRDAALKLRKVLFDEHETKCEALDTVAPDIHQDEGCSICELLEKTRWCMDILPAKYK